MTLAANTEWCPACNSATVRTLLGSCAICAKTIMDAAVEEVGRRAAEVTAEAAESAVQAAKWQECQELLDEAQARIDAGTQKPSNPKDIVGVRKAPMSTVSAAVLAEVGVAMLEGAAKYGRHNYRAVGVRGSVYYDAVMRHMMAWWEGEDIDPESGMSHIVKAITSLTVLRDAMIQGKFTDDRPPTSAEFYQRLNALAGEILDRHADKNPTHYTREGEA